MMKKLLIVAISTTLPLSLLAAENTALSTDSDTVPALTQLMNSRMFKGLSICTADPWKGLEYAKNLELEYLQWTLTAAQGQEEKTLQKDISQFVIKAGRELQDVREKCLSVSKDKEPEGPPSPKSPTDFPGRDKEGNGIP